jgi:hypothetical protein
MNPAAEKLFKCHFEEMQGWPIKELGLQNVLSKNSNKVAEFEIKQHKKRSLFVQTNTLKMA